MLSSISISALIALLSAHSALAHGVMVEPKSRTPGPEYEKACGGTAYNTENSDPAGNIQGLIQQGASQFTADCKIWQCKGLRYEDNVDNVHTFAPGQTLSMQVEIRAPHDGYANVSIVNTATDSIIGEPMIQWANPTYASSATGPVAGQSSFDVTLPTDGMDVCAKAGNCVLQWFWSSPAVDQTYEACADFVTSGSASAPATPAEPEEPVAETPDEEIPVEEQPVEEETPIDETNPIEDAPVEEDPVENSSSVSAPEMEPTTQVAPMPITSVRPQPTSSTRPSSSSVVVIPPVAETTEQATIPAVESPMPQQPDAEAPEPVAPSTPGQYTDYSACMKDVNECKNKINQAPGGGSKDFASCDTINTQCNTMRRMKMMHKRRAH